MLPTHWSQGWGCICGTSLLSGLFPEPILQLRHRNCGPDFFLPRCFCSLIATSRLPLCRAKQGRQSNGRISPHSPRAAQQQLPAAENAICAVLDLGFTPFVYPWLYQCCTLGKPPEFYLQAGGCNKSHPSENSCRGDISTVRQLHGACSALPWLLRNLPLGISLLAQAGASEHLTVSLWWMFLYLFGFRSRLKALLEIHFSQRLFRSIVPSGIKVMNHLGIKV